MSRMDTGKLIRRARAGEEAALNGLCAHYHPILCRFFRSLLRSGQGAEDLAQDTLIAMLRALPSYRAFPGKSFTGWLMRIGYNRFIDQIRRRTDASLPDGFDPPDPGGGSLDQLIASERALAVRAAMDCLDEESRAMVSMRYELQLRYKDIAQALGITEQRVKWRLNDALMKLRRLLLKEGFEWTS